MKGIFSKTPSQPTGNSNLALQSAPQLGNYSPFCITNLSETPVKKSIKVNLQVKNRHAPLSLSATEGVIGSCDH